MKTRTPLARARSRVGLVLTAVWLSSVLAIAWPAGLQIENLKITPVLIQKESSPSLPPEVQQLEAQTAPAAFDRDTVSEHSAYADGFLVAVLDGPTEVRSIKVYGAAPYTLSVQADVNGAWQAVSGLQNLNLANRPEGWNSFDASSAVTTAKLRFALTAAAGSASTSLKGIEIWGKGARVNVRNGSALLAALLSTSAPPHARIYRSTLAQGVIGAAAGGTDDPADNSFAFTLDRNPANFKRAYLTYQVLGLSHWVHAVRSINGAAAQGGFVGPLSTTWSTQVEEINPQWLAQAANSITFSAPPGATGTYTVKDVFLIAELESGANFVSGASDNQGDATNPAAAVLDGDAATGWTPYPGGNAVQADIPTLTLAFDKRTQLEGLALNLVGNLKGSIAIEFLKDGAWSPSGAPTVVGGKLITGWNTIAAPSGSGVDGVRLVFSGGKGSNAEIKEIVLSGSGTGPVFNPPQIGVTFPDAGQFFGRLAHIRGFLQPLDNGSGAAALTVGGVPVVTGDGAYAFSISKEDVGLAAQGDSEAWTVEVKAVYPNGQTITKVVTLSNWQPALESTATSLLPTYAQSVPPGQAKKMTHDAGTLDIPANALQFETTIGITPLGETDLPALDAGMTNVTKGPRKGYRFTPTPMKFVNKVKVTLPYSQALIPPGYTEQDVRTFYFDKQSGSWKVLERESIDAQANTLTSLTDHFTDMINATVTVPDHPETASFNPTQIKDIKAADPGAQVNLIDSPKANNAGDARLSYPIEVPPGRQGMQPQLALQYSSAGGNGWVGIGWDLPIQAVTIDTRWGVPRYGINERGEYSNKETETYILNGEQLTPLAHRGEPVERTADKVFHTRIEGQFKKIIRRGTHPNNYSWEVTDKNGVRYLYGATDPATETLSDADGNRFLWALCEIRDPNGNFVKFRYAKVSDPGVDGAPLQGSNIYLKQITYTGHGLTEGQYAVTFTRDREVGETLRTDKQIDARGGFKRVTADLLRKIEVSFAGQAVRSYEFRYNENPYGDGRPGTAFSKTLLTSVSQFGADSVLFNKHTLTYYDEVRDSAGIYRPFAAAETWNPRADTLQAGFITSLDAFPDTASALSGQKGSGSNTHVSVTFGINDGNLMCKSQTIGGKLGFSSSTSEGLLALVDINGDGLPDKVFATSNGLFWRKNLSGPGGGTVFDERLRPIGGDFGGKFSHDRVRNRNAGIEAFLGCAGITATAGVNAGNTNTSVDVYFSDVNGDGLMDLVVNGAVFFNRLDGPDNPVLAGDSAGTPNPIGAGAVDPAAFPGLTPQQQQALIDQHPLHDTVRVWEAPFAGTVAITGAVRLIQDTSVARRDYGDKADGVRVTIQLAGSELFSLRIPGNDYDPHVPTGVSQIPVSKGDRIYFRVQSVFDGAFDQVEWAPVIEYVNPPLLDANRKQLFTYSAGPDFLISAFPGQTVGLPLTGQVAVQGMFSMPAMSDDVTVTIFHNQGTAFEQTFPAGQPASVPISLSLAVNFADTLRFRVASDSNIDWSAISFTPRIFYTAVADPSIQVFDLQGNPQIKLKPAVEYTLYTDRLQTPAPSPFVAPVAGSFFISPVLSLAPDASGTVIFTVKRNGLRLAKQTLTIANGAITAQDPPSPLSVTADQGDALWLEFHSTNVPRTKVLASSANVGTAPDDPNPASATADYYTPRTDIRFGPMYRQWGQFVYNGNGAFGSSPIDETALVTPTPTPPGPINDFNGITDEAVLEAKLIQEGFDPAKARFIMMVPDLEKGRWQGFDDLSYVMATTMSSSRLGEDDLTSTNPVPSGTARAIVRTIESSDKSFSFAGGVSAGGFTASGGPSITRGTTRTLADFMDLNGDRYPDIVSTGSIQYTTMLGGLETTARPIGGLEQPRVQDTRNDAVTLGGSYGKANPGPRPARTIHEANMNEPSIGLNGSFGRSQDDEQFGWADVNGDGLPDRVYRGGDVALNLGYRFAPREPWNFGNVSLGKGESLSAGLGFNIGAYSIGGGVSVARSENEARETLMDVNGDGLPDKVFTGSPVTVAINTGNGFLPPVPWTGSSNIQAGSSSTESASAYFTFCIPLPPPPLPSVFKLCFNAGGGVSQTAARQLQQLNDVDGDGNADFLTSSTDNVLSVARSTVGRTNLLKKVHRPLGATFDVEYRRDGNIFELPQSRWVMSRLSVFDGHVGEGADRQVTTFVYSGPSYDRRERDFYGYGTVIERHHDPLVSQDTFFRSIQRDYLTDSYYRKGLLASEASADSAGRKFLETLNTYVLRDVETGAEPADAASTTATIFPQLARTDKRFYEGGTVAQKSTATLHQYDQVGNMSRFADAGDVGAADDVDAIISYTVNDPACVLTHIVGKPRSILVTGNGALMRQREADIDCTTGNVRQVRQFVESGQAVNDLTYFPSGNIQSVTGPANRNGQRYRLDYLYDPTVDTHVARITDSFGLFSSAEYDLRFGTPTITTDVNGQRTTYAYDVVGRVDTIVGPYEQGTGQITIDFDYAPVQTATSDSSGATIPLAQVPFAFTKHIDKDADGVLKSSGTIDTILFIDGLKRVIQTKKDLALHTGPGAAPADVMTVSGQVTFDAFGRIVTKRHPMTEPKGTNTLFNPGFDSIAPTTMTYDVLDRNTRTTIPDGTFTTLAYGFGADRQGLTQFEITITDANSKVKQTYRDTRELITSVKEFNQGATIWTSYAYDPLKQIVRVVDDKLNATAVAYDNLGRRTVIDNPDTGRTETQYDLASNVIKKITANLRAEAKAIDYNYDFNRLTAITYPNFPGNNVSYTYGAPGAAGDTNGNRAGRITRVTSQMGQEERFYGRLGEMVKEVKTIVTAQTPNAPEVYTTLYQFDTWNRLMRMTYPDLEVLTYAYDSGGLVTSAQGKKNNFTYDYLRRLEYDKFESRAFVEVGNNVRTRYAYDERTRRLCAVTSDKGTGGTPTCVSSIEGTLPVQNNIQNLLYVYDNVGNVRGTANSIPVPQPNEYGGPTKQAFVYDDLYRLTSGSGTYSFPPSKTRSYQLALGYDSIHNIQSKSQSDVITQPSGTPIEQKKTSYAFNYAYNPSGAGSVRPHAPIHIGDRTFRYDANGNQLGWDHDQNGTRRNIVWDEENRIQSLFDNGHEKTYKYDDAGQRIIKRGPQGETVYVNQWFTIRNKENGTKHVFAGTSRLVSKLMKQDKPGANPQGKTPVEKDLYFFHPDHLGSSHYITDTQGKLFEHLEYFAFGETWVEESSNTQRTPYLFTGKELDEETGLYYYGARYYDPRTTVWQSVDPILGSYLAGRPNGGVFSPINLALYSYVGLNPQKYIDPTGMARICASDSEGRESCVLVDGNADGNSLDDDLSRGQIAMFSTAYRDFILRNNNRDIGRQGAPVFGGTRDDGAMVRVASQFVGASLEGGWGNTRIEIASQFRVGSYVISVDLGHLEHRVSRGIEEYVLYINPANGDHRTNPSSIARTLTHESLHRGRGMAIQGDIPSHRQLDENAKALIRQWGLAGSGCPAAGSRTGFMGLWGPQFFSGC